MSEQTGADGQPDVSWARVTLFRVAAWDTLGEAEGGGATGEGGGATEEGGGAAGVQRGFTSVKIMVKFKSKPQTHSYFKI